MGVAGRRKNVALQSSGTEIGTAPGMNTRDWDQERRLGTGAMSSLSTECHLEHSEGSLLLKMLHFVQHDN